MAKSAKCPYGAHSHYSKKAFNACKAKHEKLKWTKSGERK